MKLRIFASVGAVCGAVAGIVALGALSSSSSSAQANRIKMSFAEDVMPILVGRCFSCHQPGGQGNEKSGLDLSSYEGIMRGTKFGKMVIPGDADSSNLMWLLDWRGAPDTHMPRGKRQLSICDRNAIRAWINEGAKNN